MIRIVFVCTGNTCRSPMAEAVFNHKVKELGIDAEAYSFGIYADGVSNISDNAKDALLSEGIVANHLSQSITKDALIDVDYIFGMTKNHAKALIDLFPDLSDKIYVFPIEISDPFGGNVDVYKNCLEEIKSAVNVIISMIGNDDE